MTLGTNEIKFCAFSRKKQKIKRKKNKNGEVITMLGYRKFKRKDKGKAEENKIKKSKFKINKLFNLFLKIYFHYMKI